MLIDIPTWLLYLMLACTLGMIILLPGIWWATNLRPKERELEFWQQEAKAELKQKLRERGLIL